MQKSILCVDRNGHLKPLIKIIDSKNQVICSLIARGGDHLTIHSQADSENLLFTYSSKNKVPSTWDPMRVELARKLGYKNPERHGQYFIHDGSSYHNSLWADSLDFSSDPPSKIRILKPIISLNITKKDYLDSIPEKYQGYNNLILSVKEDEFGLSIYFTSKLSEFSSSNLKPIENSLGYLSFQIEYNKSIIGE